MPYFYLDENTVYPIAQSETARVPIDWCGYIYSASNSTQIIGTLVDGGGRYFYNTGFNQVTQVRHAVVGLILVILTAADYLTFACFPLEKGLVVQR